MVRLSVCIVFVFIVFLQLNQSEATRFSKRSIEELDEPLYPSPASSSLLHVWYKRLNELENNDQPDYPEHLWKRLAADSYHLRQRRKFGNTRYGRSLPHQNE